MVNGERKNHGFNVYPLSPPFNLPLAQSDLSIVLKLQSLKILPNSFLTFLLCRHDAVFH